MNLPISSDEILQKTAKRLWRDAGHTPDTCPAISCDSVKERDPSIFDAFYEEAITPIESLFMNRLNEIRRQAQEIKTTLRHADAQEHAELTKTVDRLLEEKHVLESAQVELVGALVHLKQHTLIDRSVAVFYHAGKLAQHHIPELTPPLRSLVKMCLDANPPSVKAETRKGKILPSDLQNTRSVETRERLPIGAPHAQGTELPLQGELPGIPVRDKVIVPVLPLNLQYADVANVTKGAPLAERLWMNFILDVPISCRLFTTGVKIKPTLREVVETVFPNGWHRGNQLPRLINAFNELHQKRISWERRGYNIVQVYAAPELTTHLDDELEIVVRFPEGFKAAHGPKIDTEQMNLNGLRSAIMFRAHIRLTYFWDSYKSPLGNGKYANIYATRDKVLRHPTSRDRNGEYYLTYPNGEIIRSGKVYYKNGSYHAPKGNEPQTVWYHPWATIIEKDGERNPQCDNVPVLTDDDLIHLGYNDTPVEPDTKRRRKKDSKTVVYKMAEGGQVVIEENAIDKKDGTKGIRILQPRPK